MKNSLFKASRPYSLSDENISSSPPLPPPSGWDFNPAQGYPSSNTFFFLRINNFGVYFKRGVALKNDWRAEIFTLDEVDDANYRQRENFN